MFRILIVEGDPSIRAFVDTALTSHGYWVQTAPTAREAMALILYDLPVVPDVAVLNLRLPDGIGGLECADGLRRHFPSIRLIFMTASEDRPQDLEVARQRGPLLLKPFRTAELLQVIGELSRQA